MKNSHLKHVPGLKQVIFLYGTFCSVSCQCILDLSCVSYKSLLVKAVSIHMYSVDIILFSAFKFLRLRNHFRSVKAVFHYM